MSPGSPEHRAQCHSAPLLGGGFCSAIFFQLSTIDFFCVLHFFSFVVVVVDFYLIEVSLYGWQNKAVFMLNDT